MTQFYRLALVFLIQTHGLFSDRGGLMFGIEEMFEKGRLTHGKAIFRLLRYFTEAHPEGIAHYLFLSVCFVMFFSLSQNSEHPMFDKELSYHMSNVLEDNLNATKEMAIFVIFVYYFYSSI